MADKTREITEGLTRLIVPDVARPEEGGVFYNPVQKLSRDISVCVYSSEGINEFCDPMAASGARGMRIGKEIGCPVTCGDRNPRALELIKANAALNGIRIDAVLSDANALLATRSWDTVDIDPFGTPVPFFDLGCRAAKRVLAITATDPAALCGVYPRVTRRRYQAEVVKTEFYHEVGVRILAGYAIRTAAKYEVALSPSFAHSSNHYYRIYFRKSHGSGRCDETLGTVGYLAWCPRCLWRAPFTEKLEGACPLCKTTWKTIGPIFNGKLFDGALVDKAAIEAEKRGFSSALRLLSLIGKESTLPAFHYDHHALCSVKKTIPGKLDALFSSLRASGYSAERTHFSDTGFRTDAPLERVMECV